MTRTVVVNDTMQKGNQRLNYFGVSASQPLAEWRRKRWINLQERDDARQIRRSRAIARHAAAIRNHDEQGELECQRRQWQALLHWAYGSRAI